MAITQPPETATLRFFAYGTLRKGQRLHGWIGDEIIADHGTVTMPYARLHYSTQHRSFPYLVATDSPSDVVVGELYDLPLSDQVMSMLEMEKGAGYTIVERNAIFPDGEETEAVVCEWRYGYGDQVPDNDWVNAEQGWW